MMYKFKHKGFSLVEALMSLLIIMVIFALSIPFFTKKTLTLEERFGRQGEAFYFEQQSGDNETQGRCYTTKVTEETKDASGNPVYQQTIIQDQGRCQKYDFIIPPKVNKIDLVLVAGGGGGGGASGGIQYSEVIKYDPDDVTNATDSNYDYKSAIRIKSGSVSKDNANKILKGTKTVLDPDASSFNGVATAYTNKGNTNFIKKVTIDALIGMGTPAPTTGSDAASDSAGNVKTGKGGNSGNAILNHEMQRDELENTYHAITPRTWVTRSPGHLFSVIMNEIKRNVTKEDEISGKPESTNQDYYGGLGIRFGTPGYENFDKKMYVAANGNVGNDESTNICTEFGNPSNPEAGGTKVCDLNAVNSSECSDYADVSSSSNTYTYKKWFSLSSIRCIQGEDGTKLTIRSASNSNGVLSNTYYNAVYLGGKGGYLPGYVNSSGAGQSGVGVVCDKTVCQKSSSTRPVPQFPKGGQYGQVTILYEGPGQIGKGGLGGDAILLRDFPVTPGTKYSIYVGAGGIGGASGKMGKVSNNSTTETDGAAGTGGSSTALYDEDGNLVVMVIGGAGGFAGHARTMDVLGNIINGKAYFDTNTETPRQHGMIIVGNNYQNVLNYIANDLITSTVEATSAHKINMQFATTNSPFNFTSNKLFIPTYNYPADSPIDALNKSNLCSYSLTPASSCATADGGVPVNSDNNRQKRSSFAFYADENSSSNITVAPASVGLNNGDFAASIYNGFYHSYLDNGNYMYAGGLGGFSGLGGKAGCGGGFVGNMDGFIMKTYYMSLVEPDETSSVIHRDYIQNTFIARRSDGSHGLYGVQNYFQNCSLNSPDGQSAKFVPPSLTTIEGLSLGNAGAGGGGGGWSTKSGAGRGGNGQNGYVFISWKKK